jgi:HEAT repeat protein
MLQSTVIASPRGAQLSRVPVSQVIPLLRVALRDSSVRVRQAALGVVAARAAYAHVAGLTEIAGRPVVGMRGFTPIPAEWKGDREALGLALEDDCLALVKSDPDDRVRHDALLAVGNLWIGGAQMYAALPPRMVALLLDLYRQDASPGMRAEVVKTFRLFANDAPEMRAVLRDALVDPQQSVRHEAQSGIRSQSTSPARSLSFDEAREVLVAALAHQDPQVRLGAVQALNIFGRPAASYIPTLERMGRLDADAQVRTSAGLAIEAIQRDMATPVGR